MKEIPEEQKGGRGVHRANVGLIVEDHPLLSIETVSRNNLLREEERRLHLWIPSSTGLPYVSELCMSETPQRPHLMDNRKAMGRWCPASCSQRKLEGAHAEEEESNTILSKCLLKGQNFIIAVIESEIEQK